MTYDKARQLRQLLTEAYHASMMDETEQVILLQAFVVADRLVGICYALEEPGL